MDRFDPPVVKRSATLEREPVTPQQAHAQLMDEAAPPVKAAPAWTYRPLLRRFKRPHATCVETASRPINEVVHREVH